MFYVGLNYDAYETNNKLTGGAAKKDGHSATPLPAKQSGKTPAKNDKSKQQTPKSAGSVNCKSCGKYVFSSPTISILIYESVHEPNKQFL